MALPSKPEDGILLPPEPPGPITWIKKNLFGDWFNAILTVFSGLVIFFVLYSSTLWVTTKADWRPVYQFPVLYVVGQYPRDELWRVGIIFGLLFFLLGLSWGKWGGLLKGISYGATGLLGVFFVISFFSTQFNAGMQIFFGTCIAVIFVGYFLGRLDAVKPGIVIAGWALSPIPILILLAGFENIEILEAVSTTAWGGLLITFLLAIGGIVLSFPIGVFLALGRRSQLPVVKAFCIVFIETVRGVPLITILFMFSVILQLFLPQEARLDRVLRALMAMTVFSSAYMAENIRGGLQAVPTGQIEAAKAIGMNNFFVTIFIVLPQAIRVVIPAIVGQFISLFKDTTLVVIVGINDLLGIGKSIINSTPEFVQLQTEVYLFISVIYWVFSYLMSLASRRVEAALGVSER